VSGNGLPLVYSVLLLVLPLMALFNRGVRASRLLVLALVWVAIFAGAYLLVSALHEVRGTSAPPKRPESTRVQ
jgi:hypothetical protein